MVGHRQFLPLLHELELLLLEGFDVIGYNLMFGRLFLPLSDRLRGVLGAADERLNLAHSLRAVRQPNVYGLSPLLVGLGWLGLQFEPFLVLLEPEKGVFVGRLKNPPNLWWRFLLEVD